MVSCRYFYKVKTAIQIVLKREQDILLHYNVTTVNMAKGKELSEDVRNLIITKHGLKQGYKSISRDLGIAVSTVRNVIRKHAVHGVVVNLPGRGRKKNLVPPGEKERTCKKNLVPPVEKAVRSASIQNKMTSVCDATIEDKENGSESTESQVCALERLLTVVGYLARLANTFKTSLAI